MSLQFVLGPAGSGKSTYVNKMICREAIENPHKNYLLIVPDQFTMQTQMDMVKMQENKGILNIDVLSFGRLSYRIFEETGKSQCPVLDDTGKSLVLRTVAKGLMDKMPYLGKNFGKIGFVHEIKSSISEFMQYGISVKFLRDLSEEIDNDLMKMKLQDLATIYDAFMQYNKDKFITSEETLDVLCRKLYQSKLVKNSTIVFDGFTGFTPIQEKVIGGLLELAPKVVITLDLSHGEKMTDFGGSEKLFHLSRKTAHRIEKIAKDLGIVKEDDIDLTNSKEGRFADNPALMHLEENLFVTPFKTFKEETDSISIFSASNISSEVDSVISRIYDLLITGKYNYRDIAIVSGNFEAYATLFETRFLQLGIPAFIDRTSSIVLNPFIEFIKSAMQIIISDYSYDSVMHFLRSGFVDFSTDEIDHFERYIKSLRIRGKKAYHNTFRRRQNDMKDKDRALLEVDAREESRQKLQDYLKPLEKECRTVKDYTQALYEFITANDSYGRLNKLADDFDQRNDPSKAIEYRQIYKRVIELLDLMVSLIGDEEIDYSEYYKIFEAGIGEIKVGTIPRSVDRIVVGDIERTRLKEIKILFFTGVNDTNIPKSSDKGGILSSVERELLHDRNIDLAPTAREEMFTQKLYLYMNLCKPMEKLIISYAGIGNDGKGMKASYLIENVRRLFPKLSIENEEKKPLEERIISVTDSFKYYCTILKDYSARCVEAYEKDLSKALYSLYKENGFENIASLIHDAAFYSYKGGSLSQEIARLIYTDVLEGSVSRFEQYAKCAYAHFLKYGIRLDEPSEYEFGKIDMGNVCHSILDRFSTKIEAKGYTLLDYPDEEGILLLDEAIKEECDEYGQNILDEDEASRYIIVKIRGLMLKTIEILKYQLSRGKFVPAHHENTFVHEIDLPESKGKLRLKGKIDRIDLCHEDDKVYVKIIDYKSSSHALDVTKIYYGLEQQLVTYMGEAIRKEEKRFPDKEIIPSALLYYTISNPIVDSKASDSEEVIDKAIKKKMKMSGMVLNSIENVSLLDENGAGGEADILPIAFKKDGELDSRKSSNAVSSEEMTAMIGYVSRMTQRIGENILKGDIKASPIGDLKDNSCNNCAYKSVCGFDSRITGYTVRDNTALASDKARQIVMGGEENGRDYIFK